MQQRCRSFSNLIPKAQRAGSDGVTMYDDDDDDVVSLQQHLRRMDSNDSMGEFPTDSQHHNHRHRVGSLDSEGVADLFDSTPTSYVLTSLESVYDQGFSRKREPKTSRFDVSFTHDFNNQPPALPIRKTTECTISKTRHFRLTSQDSVPSFFAATVVLDSNENEQQQQKQQHQNERQHHQRLDPPKDMFSIPCAGQVLPKLRMSCVSALSDASFLDYDDDDDDDDDDKECVSSSKTLETMEIESTDGLDDDMHENDIVQPHCLWTFPLVQEIGRMNASLEHDQVLPKSRAVTSSDFSVSVDENNEEIDDSISLLIEEECSTNDEQGVEQNEKRTSTDSQIRIENRRISGTLTNITSDAKDTWLCAQRFENNAWPGKVKGRSNNTSSRRPSCSTIVSVLNRSNQAGDGDGPCREKDFKRLTSLLRLLRCQK